MLTWFPILAALLATPPADAEPAPVVEPRTLAADETVVVELFTSQGCGMCPDANRLLAEIGAEPGIIALGWGVSYWDVYGWTDEYARPEFVARQQAYVDAGEARRVYTPHFVINGAPQKLRFQPDRIRAAVTSFDPVPVLSVSADGETLTLTGAERSVPAEIWIASYAPGIETRMIESGSNAGTEMTHFNMVRSVEQVGLWTGGALHLPLPEAADPALDRVVLVQDGPGGVILGAVRLTD